MDSSETHNEYSIAAVIPAHNAGKYIARAIDSVLAQTRLPDEIIVVDDGSTDNTAQVIKQYAQKVTYIHQQNAGASAARNTGIQAAKSRWIAFLDGDDEWLTDSLKLQIELLKNNKHLSWSTANYITCLCNENRRAPRITPKRGKELLRGKEYFDSYFKAYPAGAAGWTGTMIIKRSALIEEGLFLPGLAKANDLDMWLRIAYRYPKIGYIAQPLAIYHLFIPGSISRKQKDAQIHRDLIKRHLILAAEKNRLDEFKPCAAHMIRTWIRSMLFDGQPEEIRKMLDEFDNLLPRNYKKFIKLLTTFPNATAWICHEISTMIRKLNLRRRATRRQIKKN